MFAFDHYQIRDHELHHIRKNVALTKSLSYSLMEEGKQLFFALLKLCWNVKRLWWQKL